MVEDIPENIIEINEIQKDEIKKLLVKNGRHCLKFEKWKHTGERILHFENKQ